MNPSRNRQYKIILLACLAGYIWIYFGIIHGIYQKIFFEVCLLKKITNLPCPSCGTTRSVAAILNGDFGQAFLINPLGFIAISFLIIAPLWVISDLKLARSSFFNFYNSIQHKLNQPMIAMLFFSIVLVNWIWNITKHL
jgi:hypothetical protein